MKKLILSVTLLVSVASFAQKEELKTLKKIYAKHTIVEKDLAAYKEASDALQNLATEESDKVYAKFYKTMYPTVVMASKGNKATLQDQMSLYNPDFIKEYGATIDETIEFEKKSGKKIYTDELIAEKADFKQGLTGFATTLNSAKNYKEAAMAYYSLYRFDTKNEGNSLHNAAILAIQSKDYKLSEKLFEEFYNSDHLNNGVYYYAINKASGVEENLGNRENRTKYIGMGLYEKPRDEKVSKLKPEILKNLTILYTQNGEMAKAKEMFVEAKKILPNDEELKSAEFNLYYNEGYAALSGEAKLVDAINEASEKREDKKFDALMIERKQMFQKALPSFEKAYELNPNDESTKKILKIAYEMLGQTEKAKTIK